MTMERSMLYWFPSSSRASFSPATFAVSNEMQADEHLHMHLQTLLGLRSVRDVNSAVRATYRAC